MKYYLSLITGLLPLVFFSQGRVPLSFKTDEKTTVHGFPYWQEVRVISKDTCFTARIHRGNPDVISNLKPGKYTLQFISLFHHQLNKKTDLSKKTPLAMVKGLQSFYTPAKDTEILAASLKEKDTLFILFSSNADENAREMLAITKGKDGYKAIQYEGITPVIKQQMIFDKAFMREVVKCEKACITGNSPKAESAPSAEMYTFELNRKIHSCIVPEGGGLNILKSKLFIIEKK